MRLVRLTTWLIGAVLLLNGSGATAVLHQLTHHHTPSEHTSRAQVVGCDHWHESLPADDTPEPSPMPGEEDCSICLGLAGLHLVSVPEPIFVCAMPVGITERMTWDHVAQSREVLGDCAARAPPVC
jgi:hypothetical protein